MTKIKTIFLVAGHDLARDPGAIAFDGTTEASLTVELRDLIAKHLNNGRVFDGSSMIDCDTHNLSRTIQTINRFATPRDILLDIHFNFNHATATGSEVFHSVSTTSVNRDRAARLSALSAGILGIPNRGAKPDTQTEVGSLGILRKTPCPALLIEPCFLNAHDLNRYRARKEEYAEQIAVFLIQELATL
jgi:N-acetylmuramoyl-L-alanine amidase